MAASDQLVALFEPWTAESPDYADLIRTIGEMFDPFAEYAEEQPDGTPGYSLLLDVDTAPAAGLPYLAQWVGERLPYGLTEAEQRQWIRDMPNQRRGTKRGIAAAAMRHLTGTRTVALHPRHKLSGDMDVDFLTVLTVESETPDPAATLEDILANMPADIELNFDHVAGNTWGFVETYGTWDDVAARGTWADIVNASISTGGGWYVYNRDTIMVGVAR